MMVRQTIEDRITRKGVLKALAEIILVPGGASHVLSTSYEEDAKELRELEGRERGVWSREEGYKYECLKSRDSAIISKLVSYVATGVLDIGKLAGYGYLFYSIFDAFK